ncbi:hypothetical protein BDA96_01G383800 [Sorghum bicolor]|uniref:Glabrous enhancer-binding protein-like DBD domain-containing protein n=2 Tax=Sorghum bicolor TaxID=4558 RepID=A0A921S2R2_SORBI|nr:probable transcription factor At5g28040 [Sorghum bicolor]EER92218.1 hypothetical protein SORBI_3001G359800 [Sorghum bicolor]KAG0550973.1 hypothetical protein BDA96_01G383800 [Sorghum bicolor]|eukprot:XP_002465220.1 probable transcription factor At5g28040 [Sorghum bicolor]
MVSSSFPDADAYGNGDSDDLDFPVDPNPNPVFSSSPVAAPAAAAPASGSGAGAGERRPLFQRLWTDEDEIVILRAFAEFTAQRGTSFASHQYDTTPFYEDMRRRLNTGFTKNQLVEKIRRLKRKYRNCVERLRVAGAGFTFRSPHEQAIFEIARTIWRPASDKHGRDSDDEGGGVAHDGHFAIAPFGIDVAAAAAANGESAKSPTSRPRRGRRRRTGDFPADAVTETLALPPAPMQMPVMTEDALPSFPQVTAASVMDGGGCGLSVDPPSGLPGALSAAAAATAVSGSSTAENPILAAMFKEMVRAMLTVGGGGSTALLGLEPPPPIAGVPMEGEKWRQQRIRELEVYLRRIDLLQDQARAALEELRSAPHAGGMNT